MTSCVLGDPRKLWYMCEPQIFTEWLKSTALWSYGILLQPGRSTNECTFLGLLMRNYHCKLYGVPLDGP
jgi:hypothetical protein